MPFVPFVCSVSSRYRQTNGNKDDNTIWGSIRVGFDIRTSTRPDGGGPSLINQMKRAALETSTESANVCVRLKRAWIFTVAKEKQSLSVAYPLQNTYGRLWGPCGCKFNVGLCKENSSDDVTLIIPRSCSFLHDEDA